MAPRLLLARGLDMSNTAVTVSLIVIIVFVSVTFIAVLVTLGIRFYRRRKQYVTVPQPNPSTGSIQSLKKVSLSSRSTSEQEEIQRLVMIRKSLASRTSGHNEDIPSVNNTPNPQSEDDELDEPTSGSSRPNSLRNDWKEFEANMHRDSSASLENHPILRQQSHEDTGRRTVSPANSDIPRHTPSPMSVRSTLVSPPPTAVSNEFPPYIRQSGYSWQRTPPQTVRSSFEPVRSAPRRSTLNSITTVDSTTMQPQRGTFDTVPEEYFTVSFTEGQRERHEWV